MMPICGLCTATITGKTPGLKCVGSCNLFYHGKCVGLNKQDITKFLQPDAYWYCSRCRSDASKRKSIIGVQLEDPGSDGQEPEESSGTYVMLKSIQADIKSLHSKYNDVLNSVNFCSDQVSSFESLIKRFDEQMKQIQAISKENNHLKNEVNSLTSRIDRLENEARAKNIEIQGIPEKANENLPLVLEKIGESVGCVIAKSDIDHVFRVYQKSNDRVKPIVVKLSSKFKRDEMLAAVKNKKHSTPNRSGPGLSVDNISDNIFINEHLSYGTKLILKQAKDMAKQNGFKYVWVRDGRVLVRKSDRSSVINISSDDDVKTKIK